MGLLDALKDQEFRRQVSRGLLDAGNRGVVGGLLGAPVDLTAGVVNAGLMGSGYLGHQVGLLSADQMPQPIAQPVGGSEWIGQRMQDAGMVSEQRNPLAEFVASLAGPTAMAKTARGLSNTTDAVQAWATPERLAAAKNELLDAVAKYAEPPSWSTLYAIDPKAEKRLVADLEAGVKRGPFRFGDVTVGQAKAYKAEAGEKDAVRDVYMTDEIVQHLLDRRVRDDGFTPEEIGLYARQAMKGDADVWRDPAAANPDHKVGLVNRGFVDPVTKRKYDATMPLRRVGDHLEVVTVIPRGLPARKNKTPER